MSSAFSIALSALQAQSEAINVTGNNLSNLNTTGFKSTSVDFENMISQSMGENSQIGMGVMPPITNQLFTQGALQSSSSPLAVAIQGSGFFVVNSPSGQQLFTRDGNFAIDQSGILETQTGEKVQGWMATASGINTTGAPGNISLPMGAILPPTATTQFSLKLNLDAQGNASAGTNTFSTPMQVVDSLGATHTLTVTFTKGTTANTWNYDVTIPGADVGQPSTPNVSLLTTPGALTFNTDGSMAASPTNPANVAVNVSGLANGAANMSMKWNLFDSNNVGTMTQYSQASALSTSSQDGLQAAQLTSFSIQNGGQVVATFSNGQQKVEGQLALASIQNPESLQNVGNNNFSASGQTATPAIGVPQTGGRGQVIGGSIEGSNVDLATEFTKLIVYQSAYQAGSKVITTANNMEQDLLNLIH